MPKHTLLVAEPGGDEPKVGAAIALSGGGFRAMLFHAGTLWRLGELGFFNDRPLMRVDPQTGVSAPVGKLERISSVSGGSIASSVLAMSMGGIEALSGPAFAKEYERLVIGPIRRLAERNLAGTSAPSAWAVIRDVLMPGSVNDHVADTYNRALFNGQTLQDLPDRIRFVFNASNLQSGALWRFSKPYMRDWKVGEVKHPELTLAKVVAASSAFPPVLAPCMLKVADDDYTPGSGPLLQRPPFTTAPALADGGVYDNLGLETCFKRYLTLFVSNAGKPFEAKDGISKNWASIGARCIDVMDNQVLAQRKSLLVEALKSQERTGAFWDIQQDIAVHHCPTPLPCPAQRTAELAQVPTDLSRKPRELQERLINWGYASADAAVRAWFNPTYPPGSFPYPNTRV